MYYIYLFTFNFKSLLPIYGCQSCQWLLTAINKLLTLVRKKKKSMLTIVLKEGYDMHWSQGVLHKELKLTTVNLFFLLTGIVDAWTYLLTGMKKSLLEWILNILQLFNIFQIFQIFFKNFSLSCDLDNFVLSPYSPSVMVRVIRCVKNILNIESKSLWCH